MNPRDFSNFPRATGEGIYRHVPGKKIEYLINFLCVTNCMKNHEKTEKLPDSHPKIQNGEIIKFEKQEKLVSEVSPSNEKTNKMNEKHGEQKTKVSSKVMVYLSKYMPEYVTKLFTKTNEKQIKNRKAKSKSNNKVWKIVGAVLFSLLLVLAFVSSTVGFSKCESGFRNVHYINSARKYLTSGVSSASTV